MSKGARTYDVCHVRAPFFMTGTMSLAIKQIDHDEEYSPPQARVPYEDNAVVVVGTGPVGMYFADELLKKTGKYSVVVYGSEPWKPYDRVRLSSYLAGDVGREELELGSPEKAGVVIEMRLDCAVQSIDRQARTITDALGNVQHYSHLVLAVGSRPFIPSIDNIHYDGVYTFRSLSEADTLFARRMKSLHTVIVGGGLLGLETARAMQRHNTRITIIEHNQWLMMQQLDQRGGNYLKSFVEKR